MKIAPLLIALYIIMAAIMIFDGTYSLYDVTLNPYNVTSIDNVTGLESNYTQNSTSQGALWNIFWNPSILGNNGLINLLVQALFLGVGLAIVATAIVKTDITLLTPGFVALTSAGVLPIIALWHVVNREIWDWAVISGDCCSQTGVDIGTTVNGVVCAVDSTCVPAILLSGIIIGPLAVMWILTTIEWLTARPTT